MPGHAKLRDRMTKFPMSTLNLSTPIRAPFFGHAMLFEKKSAIAKNESFLWKFFFDSAV